MKKGEERRGSIGGSMGNGDTRKKGGSMGITVKVGDGWGGRGGGRGWGCDKQVKEKRVNKGMCIIR